MQKKKILAISGSTKQNSANHAILKFIATLYTDVLDVEIFDGIHKLPHFNPDLDKDVPPTVVQEFRKQIQNVDGILICTPEYVFSLPGSLKNALEWNVSTTNFSNKPVAFIVAAASGEKAFEALDLILTTIESRLLEQSKLLIKGVKGKIGTNGVLQDQSTINNINRLTESLIKSMHAENQQPTKYNSL